MKKAILTLIIIATAMSLNAQLPQRSNRDYTMKLDSVIGADDFDWVRWKKLYSYNDNVIEEVRYNQEDQSWLPEQKTLVYDDRVETYRWNEETWTPSTMTTYEYDDFNRLSLVMGYRGTDTAWMESSKIEYFYNEGNGLLDSCLYYTIRNGNWRASQREFYTYDDNQQCVSMLSQRKGGGWGPFGDSWMDSYKYEFEYQGGEILSELYYVATGWFGGGEMSLNSKLEYTFDANGNLLNKTASIYNGEDWIVRDVYENRFDLTVDAASVRGLSTLWESTLNQGMGYVLDNSIPLNNLWLSCSIVSSNLDTQFTLYCSSVDASVNEVQEDGFKVYDDNGCLIVENVEPTDITVYDLLGRVVATRTQVQHCSIELRPGLYLVSKGNRVIKAVVR